jgi:hypothetical protein
MAGRYSLTIQVDPSTPGHVAAVINTPSDQSYAGFGPKNEGWPVSPGQFDFHTVRPGETPQRDYSNVLGRNSYATFTIPISESQAAAANAEIKRLGQQPFGEYNAFKGQVCSTAVGQIMQAAGLGSNLLYSLPAKNYEFLSNVAKTLAFDPKAKSINMETPIPEAFRGLQRDYAYEGRGYDTPSERVRRPVSSSEDNGSPDHANLAKRHRLSSIS